MGMIIGALKGFSRGVALLIVGAVVPTVAFLLALLAERTLGLEFVTGFLISLLLEAFLAIPIVFGIASEVQNRHSDAIDEAKNS
jgi:hypothetical protein